MTDSMKVLGGRNLPPHWERFDRLQRTAGRLLGFRLIRFQSLFEKLG